MEDFKERDSDEHTKIALEAIEAILKRMETLGGKNDPDEQRAIYDDLLSVHEFLKFDVGDLTWKKK